jgi:uncharacterized protein (DUF2225 family)
MDTSEATIVGSTNTFGGCTTDLRQIAAGFQPTEYSVHLCPTCGYVAAPSAFEKPVDDEMRAFVARELTPNVADAASSAAERFAFAARIAAHRGDGSYDQGWLYMQGAWCAQDADDQLREDACRRRAIDAFVAALERESFTHDNRVAHTYLVGELHRRLGNTETANEWFARVGSMSDGGENSQRWAALAAQQASAPQALLRN